MTEIKSGLRGLLSNAALYRMFQRLMGAEYASRTLADKYLAPKPGDRVLDVGCGPADILSHLPKVDYLGIDPNPDYIETARQRYGESGRFHVGSIDEMEKLRNDRFDVIWSLGVLHHLDDSEAATLFRHAAELLADGGRLITADAVFLPRQRWLARMLIANDRGRNVRFSDGYKALAATQFATVDTMIWSDIYRVPYDALVMTCTKPTP